MLIPLGILASAGGTLPTGDYELIETTVLSSTTSGVVFSNLGQYASTYKHLQIRATIRGSLSALTDTISIRFNGDTGSSYSQHGLAGTGTSVVSFSASPAVVTSGAIGNAVAASAISNVFTGAVIDILDAFSTSKNKVFRALTGYAAATTLNLVGLVSGNYSNTASITSINIYAGNASFVAGTRISLYGVKG